MTKRHVYNIFYRMILAWSIFALQNSKSKSILMAKALSTESKKVPFRVLCFGDSLTAGTTQIFQLHPYAPHLQKALSERPKLQNMDLEVWHLGFPGWQSTDLLKDADGPTGLRTIIRGNQAKDTPISLVILLAGTNDLGNGKSSTQISDGILALHKLCLEEMVSNTIAIGIPSSYFQEINEKWKEVAKTATENIRAFCESEPRSIYFPFPFGYSKDDGNWDSDGLHFSAKGYQVLGESLVPAVEDIVAKQLL